MVRSLETSYIPSCGILANICIQAMFSSGFHVSWYLQWELQIISFSKSLKAVWLGGVLWQYYHAVRNSVYLWSWGLFMERGWTAFTTLFHYISKSNSESIALPKLCMKSVAQSISFLTVLCPWFLPVGIQASCLLLPGSNMCVCYCSLLTPVTFSFCPGDFALCLSTHGL